MNLRERREALRLTQEQVAERMGVRQSQLSGLELGTNVNPKLETLQALAAALECDLTDVVESLRLTAAGA